MFNSPKIFNKFTTRLKNTLTIALDLAKKNQIERITLPHLLYGILIEKNNVAMEILYKNNVDIEALKLGILIPKKFIINDVRNNVGSRSCPDKSGFGSNIKPLNSVVKTKNTAPKFSQETKKTILEAVSLSHRYQHQYIGTEHLMFAILESEDAACKRLIEKTGGDVKFIKKELEIVLKNTSKFSNLTTQFNFTAGKKIKTASETINYFCKDLTSSGQLKKIAPVVGRDKDIERIINILGRKTKNNPLLLGEPGVGKTAIIQELAKRIYEKNVPQFLINKKLYSLDLAKILAGTVFRGEFESRLKSLIEELEQNQNIILFIDEIHSIVGLGNAAGGMDAANILKPALSSSQFQCIGATTFTEYKKHLENDAAFERRFQIVKIEEPKEDEAVEILKGVKKTFENFHQIKISDEAIEAAVKFSNRFIPEKFLPDKAIDVLDETASFIKLQTSKNFFEDEILELEKNLKTCAAQKKKIILEEKYQDALLLRRKEELLKQKIFEMRREVKKQRAKTTPEIKKNDIAETIAKMTKIPVARLTRDTKEKLLSLEKKLKQYIIGQDEICKTVAEFILRSRAGIASPTRPIGSFLFLGPTGVGKTELAKVIAREVFDDEKSLIRFDMSEFGEKFNASKLIGAPAGYVGFEEGGKLTESVRKKPYCVILFDEIEKAHPEIFNLLLSILDEGHLTDAKGVKINFKNTIIIMTSNTGTRYLNAPAIGFEKTKKEEVTKKDIETRYREYKEKIMTELKKDFRPEFVNRIDRILIFKPLTPQAMEKIVDLQIDELNQRILDLKISFKVTADARKELARLGFSLEYGARPLRGKIQELIENRLAEGIMLDKFKGGDVLAAEMVKSKIEIKKSKV